MTHEFNLRIRPTDLPHDFGQQEWATRMTYELDSRELPTSLTHANHVIQLTFA